jgi:hypothetical protein
VPVLLSVAYVVAVRFHPDGMLAVGVALLLMSMTVNTLLCFVKSGDLGNDSVGYYLESILPTGEALSFRVAPTLACGVQAGTLSFFVAPPPPRQLPREPHQFHATHTIVSNASVT